MNDEAVNQMFEQLDRRLEQLQNILLDIARSLQAERAYDMAELDAMRAQQEGLRRDANRLYLSGRSKRRDGDHYWQPPPPQGPPTVPDRIDDNNPSGSV